MALCLKGLTFSYVSILAIGAEFLKSEEMAEISGRPIISPGMGKPDRYNIVGAISLIVAPAILPGWIHFPAKITIPKGLCQS